MALSTDHSVESDKVLGCLCPRGKLNVVDVLVILVLSKVVVVVVDKHVGQVIPLRYQLLSTKVKTIYWLGRNYQTNFMLTSDMSCYIYLDISHIYLDTCHDIVALTPVTSYLFSLMLVMSDLPQHQSCHIYVVALPVVFSMISVSSYLR